MSNEIDPYDPSFDDPDDDVEDFPEHGEGEESDDE
jgi:hypothetical protein